jgi:DNA-binding beta-propeller fold protein YncE/mono/diheme cytochrome c family protein
VARTSGSAVALSRDERIAVVANRTQGSVSVFRLSVGSGGVSASIVQSFDAGTDEPWAAVFGLDDDTAYVLFKNAQVVRKLTNLHATPEFADASVAVGAEPTSILITPSGDKLFVANFGEGTVSVITTQDFASPVTIDLNPVLVRTGVFSSTLRPDAKKVPVRLGLAHPRALAITDNGDDADLDETLYVTEFFSQPLQGSQLRDSAQAADPERNRGGYVYPISMKTGQPGFAIPIAPIDDTGFVDGTGSTTGCFPNQLYSAAVDRGRLYVTSLCASPRGPLGPTVKAADGSVTTTDKNFKTLLHPTVFVIDTRTNQESHAQASVLTHTLDQYYQAGEDATDERMPLIPNEITFANSNPNGASAYVSALGADAIFRLDYDSVGSLRGIGDPNARYIDIHSLHGLPVGVALSRASRPEFALVVSDATARLSVVDLAEHRVNAVSSYVDEDAAQAFRSSDLAQGKGFFGTGRDIWSFKGQAWSSCESCHPGGLSDGVTWFFARGPRRTISTAGTYDKNPDLDARTRRMLLWGANIDELHDIEAIARGVSGGVGAVLWSYADSATNDCRLLYDGSMPSASNTGPCFGQKPTPTLQNGLNGALSDLDMGTPCLRADADCARDSLPDWRMIETFIRSQRAPHGPVVCATSQSSECLDPNDIAAGRQLFEEGRCAGCHGGPGWTVSKLFYQPGAVQNGELPYAKPAALTPADLGVLRTNTYSVPSTLLALNPTAAAGSGSATFRRMPAPDASESDVIEFLYTASNQTDDQVRCALRDVGTFPAQVPDAPTNTTGITLPGSPRIQELRQDMKTLAQGAEGFNVPSLFGLALGAPYFHAGNALTLEAVFDVDTFSRHHQALAPAFLTGPTHNEQIRQLVAFLLSIDEHTVLEPVLHTDATGAPLNHDFCQ